MKKGADGYLSMVAHSLALQTAQSHAQTGHFPEMLAACRQIIETHGDNVGAMLDVGVLLLNFGFLTKARE